MTAIASKFQTAVLPVASLEVCDRTRVRERTPIDGSEIVTEYAEAYQCGLVMEPLDVFREKGTERYIVADGEHRLLALHRAKIGKVECRLYEGDEIDALRHAVQCNQRHGLRRTKADIYRSFCRIMETKLRDEFPTDVELSRVLGISLPTVTRYKAKWRDSEGGDEQIQGRKETARDAARKHAARNQSLIGSPSPLGTVPGRSPDDSDSGMSQDASMALPSPFHAPSMPLPSPFDAGTTDDTRSGDPDLYEPTAEDRADYEAQMERESREYLESIDRVMQSDDRLATAQAEISRLGKYVDILERNRDGFMNGKMAVTELLKAEQRKTERQSKLIDQLRAEIETLKAGTQVSADTDALLRQVEKLEGENEKLRERIAVMEESA